VWCFGLFWALVLLYFPSCSRAEAATYFLSVFGSLSIVLLLTWVQSAWPFLFHCEPNTEGHRTGELNPSRHRPVASSLFSFVLASCAHVRSAVSVYFFSQGSSQRVGSRSVSSRWLLTHSRCTARMPDQIFLPLPLFCVVTSPAGSFLLRA
jgi:hypothetical protein